MPTPLPGSVDARNKFEDLSGIDTQAFSNPYDALIEACQDNPKQIQTRYYTHCTTRNAKQKADLLGSDFDGLILDGILQRLEDPTLEPGYVDPRHSLVLWTRPPRSVIDLVSRIQERVKAIAPDFWLMPLSNLHMTALEITHSVTAPEIAILVQQIFPIVEKLTDYTYTHRVRLIKPVLSFDKAAIALSFLPAAGEGLPSGSSVPSKDDSSVTARRPEDDSYTYHHLRRDLFALATSTGIKIESRYVVPSAHITVGRHITQANHDTHAKLQNWIDEIESINEWLKKEYWPVEGKRINDGGEWIVGQGKGLDLREGRLWYGGGITVKLGKGF